MPLKKTDLLIPEGYRFSVAQAGIKYNDRNDMGLIFSEKPAQVAGVFTKNLIKAAPVMITRRRVRKGRARAILVNSGNANACTGKRGTEDALELSRELAERLNLPENDILIASTGVIGTALPVDRMKAAIPDLITKLSPQRLPELAKAIMTTDTFEKLFSTTFTVGRKSFTLTGVAKGAGMIAPDMATMLSFIMTDATVSTDALRRALREVVEDTFNSITVDGDMSTNDTVLVMANGAKESPIISKKYYRVFRDALYEVMDALARMIASDGEGATRLVTIIVNGAVTKKDARKAALSIANSPLVKTAIYGRDANWGRIMAALGRSGARVTEEKTAISINGIEIVKNGLSTGRDEEAQRSMSDQHEVIIRVSLGIGKQSYRVYTCDLTEEYIRINAEYRT